MIHKMKLRETPFSMIESGQKTVELRLYDEKRKGIRVGDTLMFTNASNNERVLFCKVKALHLFSSFKELYGALPMTKCGYNEGECADYHDMEEYYSPEEQKEYGVVGIEIELDDIKARLYSLKEEKYRDFSAKLMPTVDKSRVLGVRIPLLRKMAKELTKTQKAHEFIKSLPHEYFEEYHLHSFIISENTDFESGIKLIEELLPHVDNWSVCDSMNPKCFKSNKDKLIAYIEKWLKSEHIYTVRFGIKALMDHFLDEDFKHEYADMVAEVKGGEYYIDMMRGWYFATALAKRWSDAVPYIENSRLDRETHNRAIQKAVESYRIANDGKTYLKTLKR